MSHPFAPPTPPWLWSTHSQPLDFGSYGDVRYSGIEPQSNGSKWTFMQDPKPIRYPIARLAGLIKVFPRTNKYEPISSLMEHRMVRNMQKDLDGYIPKGLLSSLSLEAHNYSQKTESFGGNCLEVIDFDYIIDKWIALPTGKTLNELSIAPLVTAIKTHDNKFAYQWHDALADRIKHATFITPIEQICSSKLYDTLGSTHIAVRDINDITFFAVRPTLDAHYKEALSVELADTLKLNSNDITNYTPIHVAFNPYWAREAAAVSAEGHVVLWSVEESNYLTKYHYTSQISRNSLDNRIELAAEGLWMACDYGAHIRSLLIASTTGIELMDIRSSKGSSLYTAPTSSSIVAFRRPLRGPAFQTFFATKTNLVVLDQRFSQRPLLSWPHHHFHHPKGIDIVHGYASPGVDGHFATLITWSPRESHCHAFEYTTGTGLTPPRGSKRPFAIPTCIAREDLWSDMTGHSVRLSSRNEVAAMPPLRGLKILNGNIHEKGIFGECTLTMLQFIESGAMYSQVFCFGKGAEDVRESEKELGETEEWIKRINAMRKMEKLLKEAEKVDSKKKFKGRISKTDFEGLFEYLTKDLLTSSTPSKNMSGNTLQNNNLEDTVMSAQRMLKRRNHPITLAEIASAHTTMHIEKGYFYFPNQPVIETTRKRYRGNVWNAQSIWADIQQLNMSTTVSVISAVWKEVFGLENIEGSVEELVQSLEKMYSLSQLEAKSSETDISSALNDSQNEQRMEMELDGEKLLELMDADSSGAELSQPLRDQLNVYFDSRKRAIAVLADDLWLSSRIILPISAKPDTPSESPKNQQDEQVFRYLFASAPIEPSKNNLDDDSNMHENASIEWPKIPSLTELSKTLMEDWHISENPAEYIFNDPSEELEIIPKKEFLTVPKILPVSSQNIISASQPVTTAEHARHSSSLSLSQGIPMSMPTYWNKSKRKRTEGF